MIYGIVPADGVFPGVTRVFRDMEQFGLKVVTAAQVSQIKENDIAVFGAYHERYAYPIRRLKCKKIVLWTSPLLQMELSGDEPRIFEHLLNLHERKVIDSIWFGDIGVWKTYPDYGYFMPYPINTSRILRYKRPTERKGGLSLFCPWTPRKNILTQLAATKLAQKDDPSLVLYANGMGPYEGLAKRMGVSYVDCGWMKPENYYVKVQEVQAGLQVFLSESFAYTALDHLLMGTPIVASPSIDWAPDQLKVANIDDPVLISDKIIKVANDYSSLDAYREAALDMAQTRNKRVSEALQCHANQEAGGAISSS